MRPPLKDVCVGAICASLLFLATCSDDGASSVGGGADTTSQGGDSTAMGGAGGSGAQGGNGATTTGGAGQGGNGATGGEGGTIVAGPSTFAVQTVDHHRNRLLDTLALRLNAADRCTLWNTMTTVEKGIFLTHTDMLGHRSCLENASVPSSQMKGRTCNSSECTCTTSDACSCAAGSEMALDHVFKVWAVNGTDPTCCSGTDCCNGGAEWHRTYFSADLKLIAYFRDVHAGLPEWSESGDFAGPHDPFTQSDETQQGTPRGQVHFWTFDSQASVLDRNGVEGVLDPHIVELDNDYNILHDSNSEGTYSFTYGRVAYKKHWNWTGSNNRGDGLPTTFLGNGAPTGESEIASDAIWLPSCGPKTSSVTPKGGGNADDLKVGTKIVISGSNFLAAGNAVHLRTQTIAVTLTTDSPLVVAESATTIELQVPTDIGTGEGFVYIESGGILSNLTRATFQP